ncbi:Na+/alanine symporter [Nocardiopsis terrae]|uniref:AGCS family alanine or glycine:cation symporter n=1 Tax=Nocardiopsis terrae TaxID=372655 RepID=A0ABR9HN57_9ACTN|nr:alanine/glycine:cation symporter family protein [Nocardiopsis terrae]MBE1460442.1 AGCS family alanine or glycine:cation symporter [Nocardiopsis terrae]GHC71492.1 Na+/alanine symporter [Nocardiopsis terrae]
MLLAAEATTLDARLTEAIAFFNNEIFWSWILIPLLVVVSLYFTIGSGLVQVRLLPEMFRVLKSKPEIAPDGRKAVSSIQAFMISAAARIGTGNIIGVAVAISLGGPGAVFWMWMMALIVGAASFVESTLAQLYKVRDSSGYRGGPSYYMERGLGARWAGVLFSITILATFAMVFNAVQSNTIVGAVGNSTANVVSGDGWLLPVVVGAVLVGVTALVIFGGVRRIAHTAQALIPSFALAYLVLGLVIMVMNYQQIPAMFALIVEHAFGVREFAAAGLAMVIIQGVRRGMFSNEAGLGSAPVAAASASVSHPVKQGLVQTLGVYFDTLVVCSMTAFIILLGYQGTLDGAREPDLTQHAVTAMLGPWSMHLMTLIIVLVAFTSVLGNYYYGESNLEYLTNSSNAMFVYKVLFLTATFLGALGSIDLVWTLADTTMGLMALVNLVAITPLAAIAFRLLKDYTEQRKQGLDPVFTRDRMPDLRGVECWDPEGRTASAAGEQTSS